METRPILIDLPEELLGERVLVRPYRAGDGAAVFEAVDESREHLLPWLPWGPFHTTPEDSEASVRRWRANWILRDDLPVGIWRRETGRYLGGAGLHRIDWNLRSFEIGYWIRATEEGHGYVTEAVCLLVDLAFGPLAANRVHIRCAVGNERSAAIPRRLGFELEGTLRNATKDADGIHHDVLQFSRISPASPGASPSA